jgi:cytochrome c-type biogenesis protein CcmH/NrfG
MILRSLALLLLFTAAWSQAAVSPALSSADAAALKHDTARCSSRADVDACYDAIRRNPSDPALLVSLGDALVRAKRPTDAIRNYRRAAELAPNTRGLPAKISAAEAKLAAMSTAASKRYSNAAPETQSH